MRFMILLIMPVLLLVSLSWLSAAPAKAETKAEKSDSKLTKQAPPVSAFDTVVNQYKIQLTVIDKQRTDQRMALSKIVRDSATAMANADSAYAKAKQLLSTIYSKELSKIMSQQQQLRSAQDTLESHYQSAVKAVDSQKTGKPQ